MKEVLFIGSFLSGTRGSLSPTEKLAQSLSGYFKIRLVSNRENKVLRLLDIVTASVFFRGKVAHIDVFSDGAFRIAEVASFLLKLRRKKVILTLHGGKLGEFLEANKARCLKVLQRADEIYSPSNFLRETFEKNGIKVGYVPNPVQLERFVYQPSSAKNKLLWVRAFTEIYNPELPVRIVALLKDEFPDIQLTMVGPDRGLLARVESEMNKLNVTSHIRITGPVKNEDLPAYYQSHTVYLNTPSYESFGIAVLESAACGCPVVSYSVGEIPYIWTDNENILLTPELTPEVFVVPIRRLLNSEILRKEIAEKAYQRSREFEWNSIVNRWKSILEH